MKKPLLSLVPIIMALTLTACGGGSKTESSSGPQKASSSLINDSSSKEESSSDKSFEPSVNSTSSHLDSSESSSSSQPIASSSSATFSSSSSLSNPSSSSSSSSMQPQEDTVVSNEEFNEVFETSFFTLQMNAVVTASIIRDGVTKEAIAEFNNGVIHITNFQVDDEYYEINNDGTVIMYVFSDGKWQKQEITLDDVGNEFLYLTMFDFNDFTYSESDKMYHADQCEYQYGTNRYIFTNATLKFRDEKLVGFAFSLTIDPLTVLLERPLPSSISIDANITYGDASVTIPESVIEETNEKFINRVFNCSDVTGNHPDIESLKKVYVNTTIQLFEDQSFEYVLSEDEMDLRVIIGTYVSDDSQAVLTPTNIYQGKRFYPYDPNALTIVYNNNEYHLSLNQDGYPLDLEFEITNQNPVAHELIEEEPPAEETYQVDEAAWKAIVEQGLMTNRDANYSCHMEHELSYRPDPETQDFDIDRGNIRVGTPASYDPSVISEEFYELLEWNNPTSKYYYYTYSRVDERWEKQELNSSYVIFYTFNLGIIFDLTYSEMTYNEETYCYECSYKRSKPYEQAPSSSIVYRDIKYYFEDGRIVKIEYQKDDSNWTYTYSNYNSTVVTVPTVSAE